MMTKKIVVATIIIVQLILFSGFASAQILTREQVKLDENLVDENRELEFAEPRSIIVVPIQPPTNDFSISSEEWYQGIYYYLVGRLNLGDVQFHYIVGEDGSVMRGLKNGVEQVIPIDGEFDTPIVIAYLTSANTNDFTRASYDPLSDLILNLANRNSIPLSTVSVARLDFVSSEEGFTMVALDSIGRYESSLENIIESIEEEYEPVAKNYIVDVIDIEQPSEAVKPGDDIVVSLTIRNQSAYSIYKGGDSEIIATTLDNSISRFYSSKGDWISQSQVALMPEGEVLKPNEEKKYDIRLKVPLYFGQQSQTFEITNFNGDVLDGTEFTINLTIDRIPGTVIEILDTEIGTLNVRRAPGGEVFDSVLPGERFIELQRVSSGWAEIELGDGSKGWVSTRYVRII